MTIDTRITQTLTPLTEAPQRSDRDNFAQLADPFLKGMEGVPTEQNAYATQVNSIADEINNTIIDIDTSVESAAASAAMAQSVTNYAGIWSELSGAFNKGVTVHHSDANWQLLKDLPEISAVEPGTDSATWFNIYKNIFEDQTNIAISQAISLYF